MYASVRRYAGNPEFADALAARRDEVLDVLRAVPGFQAYYLIRGNDASVSVSVFDDEAGATASNEAAAGWVRENMPDAGVSAPEITGGEVVVSA